MPTDLSSMTNDELYVRFLSEIPWRVVRELYEDWHPIADWDSMAASFQALADYAREIAARKGTDCDGY